MRSALSPPAHASQSPSMPFAAPGAAKISPATLASSMPLPTKPLSPGAWPLPPSVTRRTLPEGLGVARTMLLAPRSFTCLGKASVKPSRSSGTSWFVSLMNFFMRIAPCSLLLLTRSFVGRGIGHDHGFAELARVRCQDHEAQHQPDTSRNFRRPVQPQPDHGT